MSKLAVKKHGFGTLKSQKSRWSNMEQKDYITMCLDWMGVTFHTTSIDDVLRVANLLEYQENFDYDVTPRKGYKGAMEFENITLYFDGRKDNKETIHLQFSGQGCRAWERLTDGDWQALFNRLLSDEFDIKVNFTRIDLAIDDQRTEERHDRLFNVKTLKRKAEQGEVKSRFKKGLWIESFEIGGKGETLGETLNFGSRSSALYVRFYDKRLEQISKIEKNLDNKEWEKEKDKLPSRWIRTELELKQERASAIAKLIADGNENEGLGMYALGVLKHYITFLQASNDSNVQRRKVWRAWASFLRGIEPLKLTVQKDEKQYSADESLKHIKKQWGRSLSKEMAIHGIKRVVKVAEQARSKLTPSDMLDIAEHQKYVHGHEIDIETGEIIELEGKDNE